MQAIYGAIEGADTFVLC